MYMLIVKSLVLGLAILYTFAYINHLAVCIVKSLNFPAIQPIVPSILWARERLT